MLVISQAASELAHTRSVLKLRRDVPDHKHWALVNQHWVLSVWACVAMQLDGVPGLPPAVLTSCSWCRRGALAAKEAGMGPTKALSASRSQLCRERQGAHQAHGQPHHCPAKDCHALHLLAVKHAHDPTKSPALGRIMCCACLRPTIDHWRALGPEHSSPPAYQRRHGAVFWWDAARQHIVLDLGRGWRGAVDGQERHCAMQAVP